jgi:acyl-[acyl-carrier-protein]-phospholipid O-acyltransferase/long-chain-fatty-acid--[acyl-carrier-protein] ligase
LPPFGEGIEGNNVEVEQTLSANLMLALLRNCRRSMFRPKAADSTGMEMTGGQLLMRSLILRRMLLRELLAADEKFVGLLLPPSVPAVLANVALPLCGRIAVNLNYTVSSEVMNYCLRLCGIRHVLTSRRVMQRVKLEIDAELVYLEDFKDKVRAIDKLVGALQAYATPVPLLARQLGIHHIRPDDVLTVLFTSGSTGEPKGVMLTHKNVGSNVQAINEVVHVTESDVAIGVLPFFHSYGYTATLWTMLGLKPKAAYHYSPLEAQQVGELARKHRATILMSTPTFLRAYLRRCEPEDFAACDVVFASAEKLPVELADAFEKKFGVRPVEAYGATELSPLVSVNVPESRAPNRTRAFIREGTVGRPIPGVKVKVVHPETFADLPTRSPGMILVSGPGVMAGYLKRPDLTAQAIRDGWYVTGDIGFIDEDGFITITGRESRFSKIGGEMVPHIKIEEMIQQLVSADEDEEAPKVAVTAVPDPKKGERLVVLHTAIDKRPEQICHELTKAGLPNLWIPSPDSFYQVDSIPVLGSGKLDLKALKNLALERYAMQMS